MELAKRCLDVGLYTDRIDDLRAFYEGRLGLVYEELLKAGRGVHQHRLGLRGAVLKLNSSLGALADDPPSPFRRVVISSDESADLVDPDGNAVSLSPDVEAVAVHWASSDPERLGRLLAEGFDAVPDGAGRWRVGTTVLVPEAGGSTDAGPLRARGIRYLTVQVRDVFAEHARLLSLGWTEGTAPIRLGDVAVISFVRDPDGAWVEVSQRASLTGPLPS